MSKKFKINTTNIENLFASAKDNGVSAASILEKLQFSSSALSEWKKGKSCPTIEALMSMADYFDVSVDYLLCRGNTPPETEIKKPTSKKSRLKKLPEDNDEIPYSDNPRDIMNKTRVAFERKYDERNTHTFYLPVNTQCPICHHDNQPKPIDFQPFDQNKANQSCDMVGILLCTRCHHTYSVLYKEKSSLRSNYVDYVLKQELPVVDSCYTPYYSKVPNLPEAFNKPEFEKFRQAYEDLCWAKDYQIEGLVGMAYRRALECLIKDLLISEGYKTEYNNIPKEHLANLLQAMPNEIIKDCGTIANRISNDYVHYEDDNPELDILTIKEFFDEVLEKIKDYLIHQKAIRLLDPNSPKLSKNKTLKNNSTEILNRIAEENRDLFCEQRFIDSAKMYREFPDEKRERVYACILGIAIGLNLPLKQILGKDVL